MIPQTIQELTDNKYSELRYYQANETTGKIVTGSFISKVKELLGKCDINVTEIGEAYNLEMEQAVQLFQTKIGKTPTGILDNTTWQSMILYSQKYSDAVTDYILQESIATGEVSDSPHFTSFFNTSNMKTHRRNYKDIKIVFGNNTMSKTIKNVIMRSVSVEVDTSGNPISEVYEFIAQDIVESDETMDSNKYLTEEDFTSSEIQYKYPYFNQ